MIEITRIFGFDAGHRVLGHEGKCATIHGHRYTAEITCTASELDTLGRVIDFSAIKVLVGDWIDKHLDHAMILHRADPLTLLADGLCHNTRKELVGPKPIFVMDCNPTAENLAALLWNVAAQQLPASIRPTRVKLWETPNCYAVYVKELFGASPIQKQYNTSEAFKQLQEERLG